MSNQLLINPFPNGVGLNTRSQEFDGTIQLAGSTVATGEPINWGDIISGIGYNEINWQTNSGYSGGLAAARVAFKNLTLPEAPVNEGCFRALELILPEGKIVNA